MKKFSFYFELAARWHVFLLLNTYGLGKIIGGQFHRKGHLPPEVAEQTLATVNSFDLAWTFMGHSYTYILFIGISQLIGAWCLLWDKTKLIGVAILIPILTNIIVFDAVFFDTYGALASAVIYFLLLMSILVLNKERVLNAFKALTTSVLTVKPTIKQSAQTAGIVLGIIVLIFGIEQTFVNLLGH